MLFWGFVQPLMGFLVISSVAGLAVAAWWKC